MMKKLWKLALLIMFLALSFGCAGSHVSVGVGVAVPGPWYGYPGRYGGPPVRVGRPYRGYW